MTQSAHDIAAELRKRLPGVPTKKLHKLLYYCQAHHLAAFDTPIFDETVSAWDMGPVVGRLWWEEHNGHAVEAEAVGDEAVLNTVGYVVSRYGALSGKDLEHLTHEETPWVEANEHREPHGRERISRESMRDYFRYADTDEDDPETAAPSPDIREWLSHAGEWQRQPRVVDSVERLRARLRNA